MLRQLFRILAIALSAAGGAVAAQQMTPAEIGRMLVTDLSPTRSMVSGEWLTDPNGIHALGIIYVHIPGSAGSVSMHAGIYGNLDSGWAKLADVTGLYGFSPQDAVFGPRDVTLTTLTLGPDDPRCCPTRRTGWRIDLASGQAEPLN